MPLVLSLAFGDTHIRAAERLEDSCSFFGIPCEIKYLHDQTGGRIEAEKIKPKLILEHMATEHGPFFFLDADCEFIRPPIFPEELKSCDLALVRTNVLETYAIWINRSTAAESALREWVRLLEGPIHYRELEEACKRAFPVPYVMALPLELAWTEPWMRGAHPEVNPIVVHHALSSYRRTANA